jgi:hypothetical protein
METLEADGGMALRHTPKSAYRGIRYFCYCYQRQKAQCSPSTTRDRTILFGGRSKLEQKSPKNSLYALELGLSASSMTIYSKGWIAILNLLRL